MMNSQSAIYDWENYLGLFLSYVGLSKIVFIDNTER